jgi:hypothetical protein
MIYHMEEGGKSVGCDLTKLKTVEWQIIGNSCCAYNVGLKCFAEFCKSRGQIQHVQVVFA